MQEQLQADVADAVDRAFTAIETRGGDARTRRVAGLPWVLAPATFLHALSLEEGDGDEALLRRTRDRFCEFVESGRQADGATRPLLSSFRVLKPFCEAFDYLRGTDGLLSDGDVEAAQAQIAASADSHLSATDWGAQNRATVDAAAFQAAADSVPEHPHAARWRGYGDALMEDSWGRWSIEDASIYGPFWLFYIITAAEGPGRDLEFLDKVTTRYYFEFYSRLQLPNGMMPDWGDGDWTHMWTWYAAVMMRAAGRYQRGDYLWYAWRLYATHRRMGLEGQATFGFHPDGLEIGDALYSLATGLRWLHREAPPAAQPYPLDRSEEIVEDLVSKKIAFRNAGTTAPPDDPAAADSDATCAILTYRDPGPYGRYQRDYQNQQLFAFEEMPHHGHADENSLIMFMEGGTVLLGDGGYRRTAHDGWRADLYHNRMVQRLGWPNDHEMLAYLKGNPQYMPVRTEKIHFGTFGSIDYARTRLIDEDRGCTCDRVTLFVPATGQMILVDTARIDREGPRSFTNLWHPEAVREHGGLDAEGAHWVRAWSPRIPIRQEHWANPHERELLIQFLGNRDKFTQVRELDRRFNPSSTFLQFLYGYFFVGQRLGFVTVLTPHAPGTPAQDLLDTVEVLQDGDGSWRTLGLRFGVGDGMATVGLKLDTTIGLTNLRGRPMFSGATAAVTYGELTTDADFGLVVDRGDAVEIGLMAGTQLTWQGDTLFDMPIAQHMYQGPVDYTVPDRKDRMPRWHEIVQR